MKHEDTFPSHGRSWPEELFRQLGNNDEDYGFETDIKTSGFVNELKRRRSDALTY